MKECIILTQYAKKLFDNYNDIQDVVIVENEVVPDHKNTNKKLFPKIKLR